MSNVHLEPRLSERAFRFYEEFLLTAVKNWPAETSIRLSEDATLSPTTYVARCRDAVASYREYDWTSSIDRAKFKQIDGKFRISLDPDGTIWFRARGQQGRPPGKITVNTVPIAQTTTSEAKGAIGPLPVTVSVEVVNAFCLLLDRKHLTVPVLFSGQFSADLVSELEILYDVAFNYNPARNETVLI